MMIANSMIKKIISIFITLSVLITVIPSNLVNVYAQSANNGFYGNNNVIKTFSKNMELSNGKIYFVENNVTLDYDISKGTAPGTLYLKAGSTAVIYIAKGKTLTVTGKDAYNITVGANPGIYLPEGATLIVTGEGTLVAKGGNAQDGHSGTSAEGGGKGRFGGNGLGGGGGGGAAAGIGGAGGKGGGVGWPGSSVNANYGDWTVNTSCGNLYVLGSVTINAYGGNPGTYNHSSNYAGYTSTQRSTDGYYFAGGGGGGSGGGGGGAYAIGAGGTGGGGGSNGQRGSIKSKTRDEVTPGAGGGGGAAGLGYTNGSKGVDGQGTGIIPGGGVENLGSIGNVYKSSESKINVYFKNGTSQELKNLRNSNILDNQFINYALKLVPDPEDNPNVKKDSFATLGVKMPNIDIPTKAGYDFVGYYSQKDGKGIEYYKNNNGQLTSNVRWDAISHSQVLYGFWKSKDYKIVFDIGESKIVTYKNSVTSISPPGKDGFVFEGFYINDAGNDKMVFGPNGVPVPNDKAGISDALTWVGLQDISVFAKWMKLDGTATTSETYEITRLSDPKDTYYYGSVNLFLRNQAFTGQRVELKKGTETIFMAEEIDSDGNLSGKYSTISNKSGTYYIYVNGENSGKTIELSSENVDNAQNIYVFQTDVTINLKDNGTTSLSSEESVVLKSSSSTLTVSANNNGHYIVSKIIDNAKGESEKYNIFVNGLDTGKDIAFDLSDYEENISLYRTKANVKYNGVNSNEPGNLSFIDKYGNAINGLKATTIKDDNGNSSVVVGSYNYESLVSEQYNLYLDGNPTGVSIEAGASKTLDYYSLDVNLSLVNLPLTDSNVFIANGSIKYPLTPDGNGNYKIIRLKSDTPYSIVVDGEKVADDLVFNQKLVKTFAYRTLTVNVTKDGTACDLEDDVILKNNNNSITLSKVETGKYQTRVLSTDTPLEYDIYVGKNDTSVNVNSDENANIEYNTVTLNLDGGTANFDTTYVGIKGNTLSLSDKIPFSPAKKSFSGWFNSSNKVESIGFDQTVTLSAQYEDLKYPYSVYYMIQKDLSDEYELYKTVISEGVAGSSAVISDLVEFTNMDITRDTVKYSMTNVDEQTEEIKVQEDGSLAVYAYYKNDTVNITYKADGNTLKVDKVLKNKPCNLFVPESVDNKFLQQWKIEGTDDVYEVGSSFTPTNDVTMLGEYLQGHKLTLNLDGGQTAIKLTNDTRDKISDPIVTENLTKGLELNADTLIEVEREHFIFQYWYDEVNNIIYSVDTTGESLIIADEHKEYGIKNVIVMPDCDVTIKPYWYYPSKNVELAGAIDSAKLSTERYKIVSENGYIDKNLGPNATYKFKVSLTDDVKYIFDSTPISVKYKTDQSENAITLTADANGVYTIEEIWDNISIIVETKAKQAMVASNTYITVDSINDIEATGNQETPTLIVKNSGNALTLGTDYKVTYGTNMWTGQTNAGSVTIEGLGDYKGTRVVYFNIIDTTNPTGEISITTNKWTTFLNNITFNKFFNKTESVKISALDSGSGIKEIAYYLSTTALTEIQVKAITNWSTYSNSFNINPNNEYIVYAKVTDNANNTIYLSTDGLVFDDLKPVISGIENNKTYCDSVTFTVSDAHLDNVKIDGEIATPVDGKYTIAADWKTHTIVASDKSGNKTTYNVTVNPEHVWSYSSNDNKLIATCTGDQSHKASLTLSAKIVDYTGVAYKLSDISIGTQNEQNIWNGYEIEMPVATSAKFFIDESTLTNEDNSGAETAGATPIHAGDYLVKLSVGTETNTATAKTSFTINKVNSVVNVLPRANTLTYNGLDQALLTAGSNVVGGTLKYSLEENGAYNTTIPTGKDAGNYTVWYKVFGDKNHNDTVATSITVTIAQKDIIISGIKAGNKTYNGNNTATLDYSNVSFGGIVSGERLSVTATGTFADKNVYNGKDVAISNIALKEVTGNDYLKNYKLATTGQQTTTKANITKKDITTTITSNGGTYASSITTATASLNNTVTSDDISPVITYTGSDNEGTTYDTVTMPTNAGTYTITVTLSGTDAGNYNLIEQVTDSFVVAKAKVTAPLENTNTFTYNTDEQTYELVENVLYTISNNTRTNSGSQTVSVSLNDTNNYEWTDSTIADKTFTFTINKAKVTAPSKNETVFTYNTKDQTYTLATNSLYEITNDVKKDAGTYIVNVALKDKENYLWSDTQDAEDKTYDFVINSANSKDVKAILENVVLEKTGEKIKAPLKLTYLGEVLVEGVDFNIEDNIKTDAGKYTLSVELIGNYAGTITKDWSINEVVGKAVEIELDPIEIDGEMVEFAGDLNFIVSQTKDSPSITINTPINVLEENELVSLAKGEMDIDVIVTIVSKETDDIEELSLVEINKLAKTKNIRYLDITIDKILKYKVNDEIVDIKTIPVTETEEEVEVTIDVPKSIPGVASSYKRTYTIIRSHLTEVEGEEGTDPTYVYKAEKLDTKYSNGKLTFKTKLFSDYAVMYVDEYIPRPVYVAPRTDTK